MSEFLIRSPSLSTVAAQFNYLYPQSYNFSHLPVLMTIGAGKYLNYGNKNMPMRAIHYK